MASNVGWLYEEAFCRNLGLINPYEQSILRNSRVAIAGMGGVGGAHLINLVRSGIGSFSIADPDVFETVNTNRQYGASYFTAGCSKVETMAKMALSINPELKLRKFAEFITPLNQDDFLNGASVLVDGLDAFNLEARRHLFARAAEFGIPVITAGPIGFSTAWLIFHPEGMSFDDYMDVHDGMDKDKAFAAFIAGVAPAATHRTYIDTRSVNVEAETGPSTSSACFLAAGVAGVEAVKLLLGRGDVKFVPWYQQFDPYRGVLKSGYLTKGNRGILQRIKRW